MTVQFYALERQLREEFGEGPMLTFRQCVDLVEQALCQYHGIQPNIVNAARLGGVTGGATCRWDGAGQVEIGIPPCRQQAWAVLHEVAHVLTGPEADHGPAYAETCLALWRRHDVWPSDRMDVLSKQYRVLIPDFWFKLDIAS